jgi:hypothetical protein
MAKAYASRERHGSRPCYLLGCRCAECREANAAYMRNWRAATPGYAFNARLADRRASNRVRRRAPNGSRAEAL